jgi:hypothetical protein
MARLIFTLFTAVLITSCGCSKPRTPAQIRTAAAKPTTPYKKRLDFSLDDFTGAYLRVGSRNPRWDLSATNGLTALARGRVALSAAEAQALRSTARREIERAISEGCNDPLVNYASAWLRNPDTNNSTPEQKQQWSGNYELMRTSNYSPLRRCWSAIKSAQAARSILPGTKLTQEVREFRQEAADRAIDVVRDTSLPVEEMSEAVWAMFDTIRMNKSGLRNTFDVIEPILLKNWGNTAEAWMIDGDFLINIAWDARGSGFAQTVTSEGWAGFNKDLARAEKALLKSWKIKPLERTAVRLIWVELGQGKGRDRMEKFFQWAMTLNPNSSDACNAKLLYLYPRWYGSAEDMIRFGWDCVNSTNWGGEVPMTMLYANDQIARDLYPKLADRDQYWRNPAVWPCIDAAFHKYFKLHPDNVGWHHNYFWYAVKCGAWERANQELALLGPINYDYFGGKENFEAMVTLAKTHAQEPSVAAKRRP